jgi:hypothetical protein
MKETLGIVPQVFYDLIGRVVPGAAILVVGVALLIDDVQARSAISPLTGLPTALLILVFIVAIIASYLIGVLLGAIGFVCFEHRRHRTTKFADLSQDIPIGRLTERDLPYVYDFILIQNPSAGTRLVKLRAEVHLCRVIIIGCAMLMLLYLIQQRADMTPVVGGVVLVLMLAAAAAYLFHRHLQVRAWLLQINCWNILNPSLSSRSAMPTPKLTPAGNSLVLPEPPVAAASQETQADRLLIKATSAESTDRDQADDKHAG